MITASAQLADGHRRKQVHPEPVLHHGQLTFTLSGNQLTRVDDAATASAYNNGFGFKDAVKQANEYAYDPNGNLSKDLNKNISSIQYNCLNLPSKVTFGDGSAITYTYSADGTKLRAVYVINGSTTTTDYCGNVVYENGTQKWLLTDEGYVSLSDGQYHYYLKDHQGNNRVVINSAGTVEETNHYYPFGGIFASSASVQPYKYNGKEYDGKKGLNWYDYGARWYDAGTGRFTTNDRFAEKYYAQSTYQYGANNPVNNVDVNGDSIRIYIDSSSHGHAWLSVGEGDEMVMYSYGRYNGTYKGRSDINFLNFLGNGEGVLLRFTGNEITEYLNTMSPNDISVYVVTDISENKLAQYLDNIFYSSNRLPDYHKSLYRNNPSAHVVDRYILSDNNCTTFVSDALNKSGSNVLKIEHNLQTGILNSYFESSTKVRFIMPIILRNHLNNMSSTNNGIIYKTVLRK